MFEPSRRAFYLALVAVILAVATFLCRKFFGDGFIVDGMGIAALAFGAGCIALLRVQQGRAIPVKPAGKLAWLGAVIFVMSLAWIYIGALFINPDDPAFVIRIGIAGIFIGAVLMWHSELTRLGTKLGLFSRTRR